MLSDLEKMVLMLCSNHFEGEDREFGNLARRPESPNYDALVDHYTNSHTTSGEIRLDGLPEMAETQEKLILVVVRKIEPKDHTRDGWTNEQC